MKTDRSAGIYTFALPAGSPSAAALLQIEESGQSPHEGARARQISLPCAIMFRCPPRQRPGGTVDSRKSCIFSGLSFSPAQPSLREIRAT